MYVSTNISGRREPVLRFSIVFVFAFLNLVIVTPVISVYFGLEFLSPWPYFFFSPICHQESERCFVVAGTALAVCQRCTGIYLGLFLGSFFPGHWLSLATEPERRRAWVAAATFPLILDACLPLLNLWESTPASRFISGIIFGTMASGLLVSAISGLLKEEHWRKSPAVNTGGAV